MLVRCDVCGVKPAAVLCSADEAALCSGCDRRVHLANKLADKHRRVPLVHPNADDSSAAAPLCDVCKEHRALVFCVEDRAILCADCDDPIHSANDLTAKHTRFLLVGAKLSAVAPVDEPHAVAAVCAPQPQQGSSTANGASDPPCSKSDGSSISDYLTNICPGWRVDDLLFDDAAFSAASEATEHEQVPSLDADLFDMVAARPAKRGAPLGLDKQPPAASIAVPTKQHQGRVRERHWSSDSDNDLFAVPEISQQPPNKKARPSSFWCF